MVLENIDAAIAKLEELSQYDWIIYAINLLGSLYMVVFITKAKWSK